MFTASTEHDSKTINTITYTCFNRIDYQPFHGITFGNISNSEQFSDGRVSLQWKCHKVLAMMVSNNLIFHFYQSLHLAKQGDNALVRVSLSAWFFQMCK